MGTFITNKIKKFATWLGWVGIVAGIISFLAMPVFWVVAAIILGIITVFFKRTLGWLQGIFFRYKGSMITEDGCLIGGTLSPGFEKTLVLFERFFNLSFFIFFI